MQTGQKSQLAQPKENTRSLLHGKGDFDHSALLRLSGHRNAQNETVWVGHQQTLVYIKLIRSKLGGGFNNHCTLTATDV